MPWLLRNCYTSSSFLCTVKVICVMQKLWLLFLVVAHFVIFTISSSGRTGGSPTTGVIITCECTNYGCSSRKDLIVTSLKSLRLHV